MDIRVRKAVELVRAGLRGGQAPPLAVVCRSVNLSPSRIRHLFKTEVGTSFGQFVRVRQMECAKQLLETSPMNVKEVMSCVGFNDESHFVRDFKRRYGYPPAKYRVKYRSGGLVSLFLFFLFAYTSQAAQFTGHGEEFYSSALSRTITVLEGVFTPIEAEKQVLPYMSDQKHLFKDKTVLDIGTGTGIIALYAARLGSKKVIATDISSAALSCTQLNARTLGYDSIIETRLVAPPDTTAFSVIRPGETFDVIISNPPYTLDLEAPSDSAIIDRGDLGFSIVRGLQSHLNRDGTAILLYGTFFYHEVIARFARYLGYKVDHFPPDDLAPWEQDILFNSYLNRILEREAIDPRAFKFNWLQEKRRKVIELFKLYPGLSIPKEHDLYAGLIVIRKSSEAH